MDGLQMITYMNSYRGSFKMFNFAKVKEDEDFNRTNTTRISRIEIGV